MAEQIFEGRYRPPRDYDPADARDIRRRIKCRARDLAMLAEQQYIDAMGEEVRTGMLPSTGIEFWQPAPARRMKTILDCVQRELASCRGLASILFP